MTIEIEVEDLVELTAAARKHGVAMMAIPTAGERCWLKVHAPKPNRPRRRSGAHAQAQAANGGAQAAAGGGQ